MHKTIISDTSCIIVLDKIGELNILKELYGTVILTKKIKEEFGSTLPGQFEIKKVKDLNYQKILETIVDKGEASAIALALELDNPLLIIDDLKGRKLAKKLNLNIAGTLGVILKAKEKGIIKSTKGIFEKLKQSNFRISEKVETELLKLSGE